ncbi:MAG: hypothetical protein ACN6QH_13535 [Pseudomonas sp.]|uniref:hypothetical protein n=1 Tax=Pseudomonas sp. TaxID=306 RepID=UPI003D0E917A
MATATVDSIADIITKRLDERLEKEANAKSAAENLQKAAAQLKEAFSDGLEALIEQGAYRGTYLCSLVVKNAPQSFNLGGIHTEISLPVFTICLGDDSYQISPQVDIEKHIISYKVSDRSLFFICHARHPIAVELMTAPTNGRPFTASRTLEFVGMLLTGKG